MSVPTPQHKLSELITLLQTIKEEKGDIGVVYWDQGISVTFNDFSDVLQVKDDYLYFGGFHVNGDKFCTNDSNIALD